METGVEVVEEAEAIEFDRVGGGARGGAEGGEDETEAALGAAIF